jgi:hypothetical protein
MLEDQVKREYIFSNYSPSTPSSPTVEPFVTFPSPMTSSTTREQ